MPLASSKRSMTLAPKPAARNSSTRSNTNRRESGTFTNGGSRDRRVERMVEALADHPARLPQAIVHIIADRKGFDQLRGILVSFAPNFEILPGTAAKQPSKALKPFEMPDLAPPDAAGD